MYTNDSNNIIIVREVPFKFLDGINLRFHLINEVDLPFYTDLIHYHMLVN